MNFWDSFIKHAVIEGLNTPLPHLQETMQENVDEPEEKEIETPVEPDSFWKGFKQASMLSPMIQSARKGIRSGISARVGARATSNVATAAAFKPLGLPTPKPLSAKSNLLATPAQRAPGVGKTNI